LQPGCKVIFENKNGWILLIWLSKINIREFSTQIECNLQSTNIILIIHEENLTNLQLEKPTYKTGKVIKRKNVITK
jgi:hypothetical protein